LPAKTRTFVFNLMRIAYPNFTVVSVIKAKTREEAERYIPEGWQIVTCKESE
jgi:hypothetical protein